VSKKNKDRQDANKSRGTPAAGEPTPIAVVGLDPISTAPAPKGAGFTSQTPPKQPGSNFFSKFIKKRDNLPADEDAYDENGMLRGFGAASRDADANVGYDPLKFNKNAIALGETDIDVGAFVANRPAAAEAPPALPVVPRRSGSVDDEWGLGWKPEGNTTQDNPDKPKTERETRTIPLVTSVPVETGPVPKTAHRIAATKMFSKIAHVCLYVENLERSVEFYLKLGFRRRFGFNRNGKRFGAYLEFGNDNFIELFEDTSGERTAKNGRLAHFCLETSNIDAAMKMLTERGVEFTPKKMGCDATYQIWLKDPDGNDFEIHQYTPRSAQLTGGDVEADW